MHKKFLLDTSAYEELKLDSLPECIELYSTATAQRELLDTSRDFLRRTLVDKYEVAHDATVPKTFLYKYHMNDIDGKFMKSDKELPHESFIVGTPNVGCSKVGGTGIYHKIFEFMTKKRPDKDHKNDSLIGEVAIINNLVLVTKDKLLLEAVKANGGNAIKISEFNQCLEGSF